MTSTEVYKSNRLVQAVGSLSLTETRIIQLAIVDARETQTGLHPDKPLTLSANRYAQCFSVSLDAAYLALMEAEKQLFERRFTIDGDDGNPIKSRWIQDVTYIKGEAAIKITFTHTVVKEITHIDGYEQYFTRYRIEQVSGLTSNYAVRLYELLIQWKEAKFPIPMFSLDVFREQMGVGVNEYARVEAFKRRVLDVALAQINEHTDITASYEQVKSGRTITGFKFKFKFKPKAVEKKETQKIDVAALLTEEFVSKHAQIGESWEQARTRLRKEAATGKFSLSLTP